MIEFQIEIKKKRISLIKHHIAALASAASSH